MDDGDAVVACDGRGGTRPAELAPGPALAFTEEAVSHPKPTPALHVLQALPKGRRLDDIVQALVELGVERVTPVAAARSVVELRGAKRDRARQRWAAVARAAAAQSRRSHLPQVDPVTTVSGAVSTVGAGVVPHVGASVPLSEAMTHLTGVDTIAVAVGPEGGWTDDEVRAWCAAGLVPVTLGPTVLRTEHAAFAVVAAIAYANGRMA